MAASRASFFRFKSIRILSSLKSPSPVRLITPNTLFPRPNKLLGFVPNSEQTALGPGSDGIYDLAGAAAQEIKRVQAISIGEVLWDIVGSSELLGGAPFNFAVHLRNLGHEVAFVSGVGDDERGNRVLSRMREAGLTTDYIAQLPAYPTGTASVTLDGQGQPQFVINHPAAYHFSVLSEAKAQLLCSQRPQLIYFGTLGQMSPGVRQITRKVLDGCHAGRRFYDVNLRTDSYSPDLVHDLMSLATVIKVNDDEVGMIASMFSGKSGSIEQFCRDYARQFGWEAVCVTRGAHGCLLLMADTFVASSGYPVRVADTIGSGDAFAAALAHGLVAGWNPDKIADFANRVGALVASRAGATPSWTLEEAFALQRSSSCS